MISRIRREILDLAQSGSCVTVSFANSPGTSWKSYFVSVSYIDAGGSGSYFLWYLLLGHLAYCRFVLDSAIILIIAIAAETDW